MAEQTSILHVKLPGEVTVISWAGLQPFFARGVLLQVDTTLDLVEVAKAPAGDDREKVTAWLSGGGLSKVGEDTAKDLPKRDPALWTVAMAPWVIIQGHMERAALHQSRAIFFRSTLARPTLIPTKRFVMFEPGHLHLISLPGLDQQDINIRTRYEVRQNAGSGAYVHFDMDGEIGGRPFSDSLELPRDTAFNFAGDAARVAQKHDLYPKFGAIARMYKKYGTTFEDIRAKLHTHPSGPVDLERIIRHE